MKLLGKPIYLERTSGYETGIHKVTFKLQGWLKGLSLKDQYLIVGIILLMATVLFTAIGFTALSPPSVIPTSTPQPEVPVLPVYEDSLFQQP
ncbi:hypothetical protein [Echinicola sp. 20G]|uniref:hypothetical protein n=1 Tax=Echinicola sp. 20G TaxID=2781961 RepID=UPI00191041B9|nr:hypothetical protein [Echinicola sp. 20G]